MENARPKNANSPAPCCHPLFPSRVQHRCALTCSRCCARCFACRLVGQPRELVSPRASIASWELLVVLLGWLRCFVIPLAHIMAVAANNHANAGSLVLFYCQAIGRGQSAIQNGSEIVLSTLLADESSRTVHCCWIWVGFDRFANQQNPIQGSLVPQTDSCVHLQCASRSEYCWHYRDESSSTHPASVSAFGGAQKSASLGTNLPLLSTTEMMAPRLSMANSNLPLTFLPTLWISAIRSRSKGFLEYR